MKKWFRIITAVVFVAAVAVVAWIYFMPKGEQAPYKTQDARIKSITRMVELCTADIHEEWAIKDSINGKWIVARQTIEGRIRFDLDSLRSEQRGDTTFVYLPAERIDMYESASPGAYEVLDAWDGRNLVFPRTLTAAEENVLKRRWQNRTKARIYKRGYVKAARANAVKSLQPLLSAMRGPYGDSGVLIIVDPTPDGTP